MNSSTTRTNTARRPCFIEEDDGLASLADMGAASSGNNNALPLVSRPLYYNGFQRRSSSLRNLTSLHAVPSPRSVTSLGFFHEDQHQPQQPHFLDSCFLCRKPLGDRDIFMYRGDTPFCSEECRQEQIEMDEAKEKSLNSMKALRKRDQRTSTSPNKTNQSYRFPTSTVAAA